MKKNEGGSDMKNKKIVDYILLKLGFAFVHIETTYKCKACGESLLFQCDQDLDICAHCNLKGTATKEEAIIISRRGLKSWLGNIY